MFRLLQSLQGVSHVIRSTKRPCYAQKGLNLI